MRRMIIDVLLVVYNKQPLAFHRPKTVLRSCYIKPSNQHKKIQTQPLDLLKMLWYIYLELKIIEFELKR